MGLLVSGRRLGENVILVASFDMISKNPVRHVGLREGETKQQTKSIVGGPLPEPPNEVALHGWATSVLLAEYLHRPATFWIHRTERDHDKKI